MKDEEQEKITRNMQFFLLELAQFLANLVSKFDIRSLE